VGTVRIACNFFYPVYNLLEVHLTLMRSKLQFASATRNSTRDVSFFVNVSNVTEVFLFVLERSVIAFLLRTYPNISMLIFSCSYSLWTDYSAVANAVFISM